MVRINLLPEEYRPKNTNPGSDLPINQILLGVNALLLFLFIIFSALSLTRVVQDRILTNRLGQLQQEQSRLSSLRTEISQLKQGNSFFDGLAQREFFWSEKLNLLSDLLVPGIWFRQIMLDDKTNITVGAGNKTGGTRRLIMHGTAVSVTHEEMAVITELIRGLKADKRFFAEFRNIELESVLRRKIGPVEVMDFTLVCLFKDGENQP